MFFQKRKKLDDIIDQNIDFNENDKLALKLLKQKTLLLFNELLAFKDDRDFHIYGFMVDHKYYKWLNKVNILKEDPVNKLLVLNDGFVVGELSTLGMDYMRSKGQETEYSKYTKEKIKVGLQR